MYGFPKNERENITENDLRGYREFAVQMLIYDAVLLEEAVKDELWREVKRDE